MSWPKTDKVDFAEAQLDVQFQISVTAEGAVHVHPVQFGTTRPVLSRRLDPADDDGDVMVVRDAMGTEAARLSGLIYGMADEIEDRIRTIASEMTKP